MKNIIFILLVLVIGITSCERPASKSGRPVAQVMQEDKPTGEFFLEVNDSVGVLAKPHDRSKYTYTLYIDQKPALDYGNRQIFTYHTIHDSKEDMIEFLLWKLEESESIKQRNAPFQW